MPTGYTHKVADGTVREFKDFAMQCVRAFGALITMRDDAPDAPIPDEFTPHPCYADAVARGEAEITRLVSLTSEQIEAECNAAHESEVQGRRQREQERANTAARYRAMLEQVEAWKPPTSDHVGLKDFMREQLTKSIEYDCDGAYDTVSDKKSPAEWHRETLYAARKSLDYSQKSLAEEQDRMAQRTAWVRAFRASL